jgi:hypothetical protein
MKTNRILKWLALAGFLFGLVTIVSGGRALFGSPEARAAVGQAVPFVLWFNFLAGFGYVVAGAGLLGRRAWAAHLSLFLAAATLLVFGAFAVHVLGGGAFESRTVGAMILRSSFWIAVALVARCALKPASAAGPAG